MPDIDALVRATQGDSAGVTGSKPPAALNPASAPQPTDIMSIFRQLLSTPEVAQPRSAMEEQRGRLQGLESQYANMPLPQTGPKNLALRILAGTRPGAAISDAVYSPGIERYQMGRKQLADQIAALKGQTDISKDEATNATTLAGTAGMAGYRSGELQLGAERNKIAQQKADTFRQSVQNKLQTAMRGLDMKAIMNGSQIELNRSRIALNSALQQVLPERVQVEQYGIDTSAYTRQAVADLEAQMGLEKTHPFLNMLDQTLGTKLMPSAPQTPGGAQPVRGQKPLDQKTTPTPSPTKTKGKVLVEGKDF